MDYMHNLNLVHLSTIDDFWTHVHVLHAHTHTLTHIKLSAQPSYKLIYISTVWGFSFLSAIVLIALFALNNHPGEPGE